MAVIVKSEALTRRNVKKCQTVKIDGQKKPNSPVASIANITAMMTPSMSCPKNPTAISEKARLRNNFFTLAGIEEAFHMA